MTTGTHLLRSFVFLSLAFCLCGLSGCINSKHPLSDPEKATVDQELLGTWLWKPTSTRVDEWDVAKAGEGFPDGMLKLQKTGGGAEETFYLFSTKIGKDRYMNVANFEGPTMPERWDAKRVLHYELVHYQIDDGVLTTRKMNKDFLEKAVASRKLDGEGVLKEGEEFDFDVDLSDPAVLDDLTNCTLTASSKQLREFFAKHRDELSGNENLKATRKPKTKQPQQKN